MHDFTPKHRLKATDVNKQRCSRCRGTGRAPCSICNGKGEVMRGTDHQGKPLFVKCNGCFGMKAVRCAACAGEGYR